MHAALAATIQVPTEGWQEIIRAASQTLYGLIALGCLILGVLAPLLLKGAPWQARTIVFTLLLAAIVALGVAAVRESAQRLAREAEAKDPQTNPPQPAGVPAPASEDVSQPSSPPAPSSDRVGPKPRPQPQSPEAHADSCQYAKDGECDEPDDCAPGTDTTDCASTEASGSSTTGSSPLYCCDGFGRPWCMIAVNPGPVGSPCWCSGVVGVGHICRQEVPP